MHTRSSPANSNKSSDGASQASEPGTKAARWLLEDEIALIDFLIANKEKAGDGLGFKPSVWTAAADHLEKVTTKGGPKTHDKCKAKWHKVRYHQCRLYQRLILIMI